MNAITNFLKSLFSHENQYGPDFVWSGQEQCLLGTIEQLKEFLENKWKVVLVGHFQDTLLKLQQALENEGIPFEGFCSRKSDWEKQLKSNLGTVILLESEMLPEKTKSLSKIRIEHDLIFIVAERYPTPVRAKRLDQFCRAVLFECKISFHSTLDDSLFKVGLKTEMDKIMKLMESLGWKSEEALVLDYSSDCSSGEMMGALIKKAQKEIQRHAEGDITAESCQKWYELNYK